MVNHEQRQYVLEGVYLAEWSKLLMYLAKRSKLSIGEVSEVDQCNNLKDESVN
jgi:ribosomal protein L20A (L18A)